MRKAIWLFGVLLAAAAIPALADFAKGLAAYQKGDYVTAAKEWRPEAEEGDAPTQYNLGLLYLDGHGVPQDTGEAVKWFTRSANQDYTEAQHDLGALYATGKGVKRDMVEAYKWMNICAAKGNAGCITQRDLIAKKLKPSQVAQAQRLSSQFAPKKETAKQ
ncbi:MAG TPA: tetratricopeptide repeat protein [Bryobacteraceae bacterium]|nr:tetratricopeptide repeat protein [Bryobacteraceae bacterium]